MSINNLDIYQLQQQLLIDINNAKLPVGIIYFIVKDLFQELTDLYQQTITQELQNTSNSNTASITNIEQKKVDFEIPLNQDQLVSDFHLDAKELYEQSESVGQE